MSNRFPPLCLVIGLALAGCSGTPEQSQWTSAEAPKTLQVDHMRLEHATAFAAGSAELDAQEMARLETFLDQAAVRSGDKIYLSLPAGDRLAAQRIGRIARQLD